MSTVNARPSVGHTHPRPVIAQTVSGLPAGGSTGQVLAKNSGTDGDAGWTTPSSGGGSGSTVVLPDMDLIDFWPASAVKATASSSYASTPPIALYLRMAGATGGWITNAANTGWNKIEFPSAVVVRSYAIEPWSVDNYPSRTPKTWTFEGSNDNAAWTVLDTQTNYLTWAQYQRVSFPIANQSAYKFYRINVTANQGDTYMGMGGLWLYGQPVASNASTSSPDIPPATPNAMDDECNGVALDSKWTIIDPSGITASVTKDYGNNSWHSFSCPSSIQNRIFAITQPAPAGNYKVRSKLAFDSASGNYFGFQLIARRASVTKSVVAGPLYHSSYGVATMYATRIDEPSTLLTDTDLYEIRHDIVYLELEYDGTNLIWRQSTTGAKYTRFYQEAVATHLGAAPESIGVNFHFYGASSDANHTMVASMDWFRRVA